MCLLLILLDLWCRMYTTANSVLHWWINFTVGIIDGTTIFNHNRCWHCIRHMKIFESWMSLLLNELWQYMHVYFCINLCTTTHYIFLLWSHPTTDHTEDWLPNIIRVNLLHDTTNVWLVYLKELVMTYNRFMQPTRVCKDVSIWPYWILVCTKDIINIINVFSHIYMSSLSASFIVHERYHAWNRPYNETRWQWQILEDWSLSRLPFACFYNSTCM